jgi:uridylate kinase
MARFNRILLKLSGESLQGQRGYGIDPQRLGEYAQQVKEISDMGVQIGIVIGGGNIFRGLSGTGQGFDRVKGDQMGMLATVINSLALSSALTAIGCKNRVLTAIRMSPSASSTRSGAPSSRWNRARWSSCRAARAARTSRPTQVRRYAASKSRPT